jgi:hypothetical protein
MAEGCDREAFSRFDPEMGTLEQTVASATTWTSPSSAPGALRQILLPTNPAALQCRSVDGLQISGQTTFPLSLLTRHRRLTRQGHGSSSVQLPSCNQTVGRVRAGR